MSDPYDRRSVTSIGYDSDRAREPAGESVPLDPARLASVIFNIRWQIERLTADAQRLFNRPAREMVGSSILDELHPDDTAQFVAAAARGLAEGAGVATCVRLRVNGDRGEETRVLLSPLAGHPLGYCMFMPPPTRPSWEASDRCAILERQLWQVAKVCEEAGISGSSDRLPDLRHFPALAGLSKRQWEVLIRLLRGERPPAIAAALFISQSTVRNHLGEIYRRLGVHSQTELIQLLRT